MQVRILSIDGGGAKAIIPAIILQYIEAKLQELAKNPKVHLSDFLDFVAGTAAGAIISTLIITPNKNGKPAFYIGDVVNSLDNFAASYYRKKNWRTLWGYYGAQYPREQVEGVHIQYFDHWKMKDLLLPTAIPGYDILNRKPIIFTNKNGSTEYCDYFAKDVVQGSGASPHFINPKEFRDGIHKNIIINSNVLANNPAMIAYIEAGKTPQIIDKFKRVTPENTFMVSLGTGLAKYQKYTSKDVKHWNKSSWFSLLTSMNIQSSTILAEYEIRNLYKSYNMEDNYIRIEPEVIMGSSNIMDTSEKNMLQLRQDATNYIMANKKLLDNIALTLFNQDERVSKLLF